MKNSSIEITRHNNIQIKTIVNEETRVVKTEVTLHDLFDDVLVSGRGKAKWNPIDYYDPEVGKGISLGRAFQKFGKKFADFWESQSGSIGEHKAKVRREREIQELGEVFFHNFNKQPPVAKTPYVAPQEPTKPQEEAKKVPVDTKTIVGNLDDLIESNKAKLETAINTETIPKREGGAARK